MFRRVFRGRFADREEAFATFRRHDEEVALAVPSDRLLVHEAGEGWGPPCELLGVEQPDEPFPHLNARGTFSKVPVRSMTRGLAPGLLKASGGGGGAAAIVFAA